MTKQMYYNPLEMDHPKTCPMCGSNAMDIQGINVSPIPYVCGSNLNPDGSIYRGCRCYERQLGKIKAQIQMIANEASSILYDGDNLKFGCNKIIDTSNDIFDGIA